MSGAHCRRCRFMEPQQRHCPFLNRADVRCSKHFHLDHLSYTYEYCFGRYKHCAVYVERLVERRVDRTWGNSRENESDAAAIEPEPINLVQVTVRRRAGGRVSAAAKLSRAFGHRARAQ